MKDNLSEVTRKKVEALLNASAVAYNQGKLSSEEVLKVKEQIDKLSSIAKYTSEEKRTIMSKLYNMGYIPTLKAEGNLLDRSVVVKEPRFWTNTRKKIAAISAAVGIAVAAIGTVACSTQQQEVQETTEDEDVKEEKTNERDSWNLELCENALKFAQNEVENGLPKDMQITDENKDKLIKSLVEYYLINQMDELSDEQWANIFPNSNITSQDLIDAKYAWEWIDEQRVIVSQNHLDYKLLYKGSDAILLNDAAELLNEVKSSNRSKASIDNFKNYTIEHLRSDDNNMLYTERALDTYRAVYFDAFDELTNHAEIDDELEHAINTTYTCSMPESELNVQDKTIVSLQSEYQTYIMSKLDTRLQAGWNFASSNRDLINEKNDISHIVEYVISHIDLSKQFVLADLEETLNSMFLVNISSGSVQTKSTTKTTTTNTGGKTPSKVSDGQGGNISKEQLDKYGIDETDPNAKQKLESSVQTEEKKKEIDTAVIKDEYQIDKSTIDRSLKPESSAAKVVKSEYEEGYNDAMAGISKKSNGSAAYNEAYSAGTNDRKREEQDFLRSKGLNSFNDVIEETFEPVTNGKEEIVSESITEEGYTQSVDQTINETTSSTLDQTSTTVINQTTNVINQSNLDSSNEDVVEAAPEEIFVSESEITTYDYTYDPTEDLKALYSLKEEILSNKEEFEPVEESIEEESKTK